MEYKVNIGYTWETNDMGIANHGTSHKPVPVEDIVEGYNLFSQYHDASPAKVLSHETEYQDSVRKGENFGR